MANEYINRRQAIWIWVEWTKWTAQVPEYFIPVQNWEVNPIVEKSNDDSWIWVIEEISDSRTVKQSTEANLEWIVRPDFIWALLYLLLGSISSTPNLDTSWNVYDHLFTVDQSNTHPTASVRVINPVNDNDNVSEYASYSMINSFWISAEAWDYVKFNTSMIWKKLQTDFNIPSSYNLDVVPFTSAHVEVRIADTEVWLDSATPMELSNVELNFEKNLLEYQAVWDTDIAKIFNQQLNINWNFEAIYNSNEYKDIVTNSENKYMRISIINTEETIWDSSNYELTINCAKVVFEEWSRSSDLNGITTQTVWFIATYNTTDNESVRIWLTNLEDWTKYV